MTAAKLDGRRVYISGPMEMYAGCGYNKDQFDLVAGLCSAAGAAEVVNPARLVGEVESGALTREQAMERDLRDLLGCDAVVMLDGWQMSDGAMLEWMVAKDTGKEVLTEWSVRG